MSGISRRSFLHGLWTPPQVREATGQAIRAQQTAPDGMGLPPEFSPSVLRAEGQRLGLNVDTLSDEDLAFAVLQAMYCQK